MAAGSSIINMQTGIAVKEKDSQLKEAGNEDKKAKSLQISSLKNTVSYSGRRTLQHKLNMP